ncbi:hypothetical protein [Halomonas sp. NCCP-2165]|nr:hypothetical protein [Halomonas sp. NCCP-2165]GKW50714.1 hypothetical protein NCCP2165_29290 [Halomonas sp. NCCP-2165]
MTGMMRYLAIAALAAMMGMGLAACEDDPGPAEEAGQNIDEAMEETGESIEEMGESLEESAEGSSGGY